MADVSLDDLIKKDKEKKQTQREERRGSNRGGKPRHFARRQRDDDRRDDRREGRRRGRGRFDNRPRRRDWDDDREERFERRQERQPIGPSAEGRKLRVLGLHPDVTNSQLFKLFSQHGTLEKCLIDLDQFGRSRTTGIIIYNSADSARNAIQNLNRSKILESVITVDYWNRDRDTRRFKPIGKGRSFRN